MQDNDDDANDMLMRMWILSGSWSWSLEVHLGMKTRGAETKEV